MRVEYRKAGFATMVVPSGTVSSGYGAVDSAHNVPHTGIDFVTPVGTKLHAPFSGTVSRVVEDPTAPIGKAVFIKMEDGRQYILGHLSDIKVSVGEHINKGDLLALSGNTGRSTGPHVHFGAVDPSGKFVDPVTLFEKATITFSELNNPVTEAYATLPVEGVVTEWCKTLYEAIQIIAEQV